MDITPVNIALGVAAATVVSVGLKKLMKQKWDVKGKVIVITGASSGIGAETALHLAKLGAILVICARRERELEEVAIQCRTLGTKVVTVKCDVAVEADCTRLMNAAGAINGVIDGLILNAGISMGDTFEGVLKSEKDPMEIFRRLMEVNYYGPVMCTKAAMPFLVKSKCSHIVVVSSLAGKFGSPTRTGYSASKFACHGFFDALRCELGPKYGTQITIVCPGPVATDINRTRLGSGPTELSMEKAIPASLAATYLVNGMRAGDREVLFAPGGIGAWINFFAPAQFDRIMIKACEKFLFSTKGSAQ